MFKLFVCLSILLAAVSADYDFKDFDFNELLFDDLRTDFDDDVDDSLRFRRDTEVATEQKDCHRKRDNHCCAGEKPDPKQFEALKEVKRECIAKVRAESDNESNFDPFNCERMQVMKEQMVCTAECLAKKFDLLDDSGDLKRDTLLTHLRLKIGENKWKGEKLEQYVDKCIGELKASQDKAKEDEKADQKTGCNQYPLQFTHCIWGKFILGCPAEAQVDTPKCKKIRESLAKGDTAYLHKSFLNHLRSHHDDKKDFE